MTPVWDFETSVIIAVQAIGTWLAEPMVWISTLGSQALYIVLLPLLMWCVSARLGARLAVAVLAGSALNWLGKLACYGARPYWFDSRVLPLATESTFGVPSGHAQTATTLWGYLAAKAPWKRAWYAAVAVIVLVSFTRVYLGVHFITDVLGGVAVGALVLWLVLRYEDPVLEWWHRHRLAVRIGLALAVSLIVPAVALLLSVVLRAGWSAPEAWGGSVPPHVPYAVLEQVARVSGGLFGVLAGLSVLAARGWYSATGPVHQRVARYIVGVAGMALVAVLLAVVVPALPGSRLVWSYGEYALLGVWGALGAPELFVRMGLAGRPSGRDSDRLARV